LWRLGQRDALELDDAANARADGDVAEVAFEAVRDVEHRVGRSGQLSALVKSDRRPDEALLAKGRTRTAERAGDDDQIPGLCPTATGNARRTADGRHAQVDGVGGRCVAAQDRHAGLTHPFVELDDVVQLGLARRSKADDQPVRVGARRGQVAEVHRRGSVAEVAPGDPLEPEVDVLDQGVLSENSPVAELGRVVCDPLRQPTALELRE
jgi:hypothetical protein